MTTRNLWLLFWAAALSFVTTLTLPYVGEEGVYTNSAIEMWASGDFFNTTLYGTPYPRPPLLNWLIIAVANVLGWSHMLLASRLVTAAATVATGLLLGWFVARMTRERALAALCALVFLTSDALFYRGWLAYADSVFTFFNLAAVALLWLGVKERRTRWLWLAALAATGGYLAKVQTIYILYGITWLVLLADRENRGFLTRPEAILPQLFAVGLFVLWNILFVKGAHVSGTYVDILGKFRTADLGGYLNQLWWFPVETFLRFVPASLLALYFWLRRSGNKADAGGPAAFPLAPLLLITALNYLPFWLGPKSGIRYVMPLYPFAAILIAHVLWNAGPACRRIAVFWLAAAIVFKWGLGLWGFPAYQQKFRGDYAGTAREIVMQTGGFPLYATDVSATGLAVSAEINVLRHPARPLTWPPGGLQDGFVLSYTENPDYGRKYALFKLGGNELFLMCRGAACDKP